jgi:hypothetical protein
LSAPVRAVCSIDMLVQAPVTITVSRHPLLRMVSGAAPLIRVVGR